MLRFKILASVAPLTIAAAFAQGELLPGPKPCIAVGAVSMQITSLPWQAGSHVSFTDDPAKASVRVRISDNADEADFAVVDDIDSADDNACEASAATRFVAVSSNASAAGPIIYLSREGPADYRIFVRSKRFTVRDAAALVVGANQAGSL